jgi:hypothetical protein
MAEKTYYIYNSHAAPITANARDERGSVKYSKTFMPERRDPVSGRVESTGYTPLTGEEYKELCGTSKIFTHYVNKLKLLHVSNELPPEARTPHEALAGAREEARRRAAELESARKEITALKADVLDWERKYKTLESASSSEEALKPLKDQAALLTARVEALAALDNAFTQQIRSAAGGNKEIKAILDGHAAKVSALNTPPEKDFT